MQHRRLFVTMAFAAGATAVAACGGGGGGTPPVGPTPKPTPAAAQQQAINSSTGGTVSASLPGGGSLAVSVPANSLSANATVTIYAYTSASQIAGTTARHAEIAGLPSNGVFLAGFAIDTGTAAVLAPFKVTESVTASVPSGDVVRVARLNPKGAFTDVDTASVANGSASNDVSSQYVSVSNGGLAAPYIVYAVPSSSAATPAPIVMNATAPANQQIVINGTGSFTASGADANGNPLPFVPSFGTDNAAIATAATGNSPLTAAVKAGVQGGVVNLLVTDSRTKVTGKIPFTVYTQRPANGGNSFSFTGSYERDDNYTYPAPSPFPNTKVTANVTQTVTVSATSAPPATGITGSVSDFHTVESDAYALSTRGWTTDAYYQTDAATGNFNFFGFTSTDDSGDQISTQYGAAQLIDKLPEADGTWSNSPKAMMTETDADGNTYQRQIVDDGSYTEYDDLFTGNGPTYPQVTSTIAGNVDGSASLAWSYNEKNRLPQYDAYNYTYTLQAPSNGTIGVVFSGLIRVPSSPAPSPTPTPSPFLIANVPAWYAPSASLYTETDTVKTAQAIPASCSVPSSIATSANQIVRTQTTIDPAFGTIDTNTNTEWVVMGFGPVCIQLSDVNKAFYDFSQSTYDTPNSVGFFNYSADGTTPLVTTTIAQTLTLQNTKPPSAQIAHAAVAPIPASAIANAQVVMNRAIMQTRAKRMRTATARLNALILKGGVR